MRISSKAVDVVVDFLLDFGKTAKFVSSLSTPFLLKKTNKRKTSPCRAEEACLQSLGVHDKVYSIKLRRNCQISE